MFAFKHRPVLNLQDVTANDEQLEVLLAEQEAKLQALETAKGQVPGSWTNPEAFSAKLEETTSVQVRTEQSKTVARLKGLPKTKEEIPANTALFTLPVGSRPLEVQFLSGSDATARAVFVFRVETTGVVKSEGAMTAGHFFSFAGITFNLT